MNQDLEKHGQERRYNVCIIGSLEKGEQNKWTIPPKVNNIIEKKNSWIKESLHLKIGRRQLEPGSLDTKWPAHILATLLDMKDEEKNPKDL